MAIPIMGLFSPRGARATRVSRPVASLRRSSLGCRQRGGGRIYVRFTPHSKRVQAANQKPEFVFATRMKAHVFARACIYVILTLFLQDINAVMTSVTMLCLSCNPCDDAMS
uniref:Uncharacterized protein n=1 Tax=Timema cristinae TaxID=61476 RepID=A0A7R9CLY2_TIMCR|nr:unnamed protein product [Timema cristinae]